MKTWLGMTQGCAMSRLHAFEVVVRIRIRKIRIRPWMTKECMYMYMYNVHI